MKILVATVKPFAPEAVTSIKNIVENEGHTFSIIENYQDQSDLIQAVSDADALIIRSDNVDKEVIEAAKQLKIVVRAGAGYDNIDLGAATQHKVVAMNTPGQNANAVAELAIGMMVYVARKNLTGTSGSELLGKKLGIQAYGYVGKRVAAIARGFGMDIFAYDPFIDNSIIEQDGVTALGSVTELYETCRYVSIHIPANESTIKSINSELMLSMPKGAVLINTARKEVIDEESLLEVMEKRDDFRYASDIAPDCADLIQEKYPGRYFFTPKKMGAQTSEANINAGIAAANQIVNFFRNNDTTFQVNK